MSQGCVILACWGRPLFLLTMDLVSAPGGESSSLKPPVIEPEVADMASGDQEHPETRPEEDNASTSESDAHSEASGEGWETESLYEDYMQMVRDEQLRDGSTDPDISKTM